MSTSVTVKNPAAGKGGALKKRTATDIEYITSSVGDAEKYAFELCSRESDCHITVCGGDGTVNEVVNGIMKAGTGNTSFLSVVPSGTGNDFVRCFKVGESVACDVGKYNDRYFVNMLNIGFDCNVVTETDKMKKLPLISGSFAYILGIVKCLFSHYGERISVQLEDEHGNVENIDSELLLFAVANGSYYGGGFHASPQSDLQDGLLDVLTVKKVSRFRFITLVGKYKSGDHFDKTTGEIHKKYSDVISHRKCRRVTVKSKHLICVDGEVEMSEQTEIGVLKNALNVVF